MKRVVSRGIIFIDQKVVLLKRIRKDGNKYLHYYAIPGGGVENGESLEETCTREVKEEVNLDVSINEYLGMEEYEMGICHYYLVNYQGGIPILGGEEKEQNNPDNSYEVKLINIKDIDKIFIYGKGIDMIKLAYQKHLKSFKSLNE
ncbi:MAG: NUDIX domain-containing protein [Bacilli bacterium]|nr:NUDIX domain-containing protein [Bacilli bacterium]